MFPFFAVGIGLAAAGWLFGELTSEEEEHTRKIRQSIEDRKNRHEQKLRDLDFQYEQKRNRIYENITKRESRYTSDYNYQSSNLDKYVQSQQERINRQLEYDYEQLERDYKRLLEQQIQKERDEECLFYIEQAEGHLSNVENVYSQIDELISGQIETMKSGATTAFQRHALKVLIRNSVDTKAKFGAYRSYLKRYIKRMKKIKGNWGNRENLDGFSFTIPDNWLYKGKLLSWNLKERESKGVLEIDQVWFGVNYVIDDCDIEDLETAPLLCTSYELVPIPESEYSYPLFHLSVAKGMLKFRLDNCQRVYENAIVRGYEDNYTITLENKDGIQLSLPINCLEEPNNKPLRNAELTVVISDWNNTLDDGKIKVSEKVEDIFNSLCFDGLPILFSEEAWYREFSPKVAELDLYTAKNEWKIALANEETFQVKFQYGEELIFLAHVENINGACGFVYDGLLNLEDNQIKAEDTFIVVESSLDAALKEEFLEIPEYDRSVMDSFVSVVFDEFRHQQINRAARKGLPYFNKWLDITDKHVNHLIMQGRSVELTLDKSEDIPIRRYRELHVVVKEDDLLEEFFVETCKSLQTYKAKPSFFMEIAPGERCSVFVKDNKMQEITIKNPDKRVIDYLNGVDKIEIFERGNCYPEIQQRRALINFLQGNLVNSALKSFALDPNSIYESKTDVGDIDFFDKEIAADYSQAETVKRALEEDNLFLIQGPPGTGKTTVILELILQTLKRNPYASVLVTSQSNVAVDNVLKKLLDRSYAANYNIIRCGDSYDCDLEDYSIDKIYNDYVNKIYTKAAINPNDKIVKEHIAKLKQDGSERAKGSYCENLLSGADIVGATCVGLASRRIGLDKLNFDLVIIDEAGKALPAELLIPYNRGMKVVLLGDHKQLPPVISPQIEKNELIQRQYSSKLLNELWNQSLFERIFANAPSSNKSMLRTQYRMPANIGTIISEAFYEGALFNGDNTLSKEPLLFDKNIAFFEHNFIESSATDKGVNNPSESAFIAELAKVMLERMGNNQSKIAIITPYKQQKRQIVKSLKETLSVDFKKFIKVDTVDSFQGEEAEIVIYATTRTRRITNFFKDFRRVNVALSRTKQQLCVVGSLKYFDKYDESKGDCLPIIARHVRTKELAHIYSVASHPELWQQQLEVWLG